MSVENWLPVPGFPGYEASDLGQVRSYKIRGSYELAKTPHILRPAPFTKFGHLGLCLRVNGTTRGMSVHQLVMLAFVGPCPEGMEICHGPSGAGDNRLSNLRYDTHQANMRESTRANGPYSLNKKVEQRRLAQEMYLRAEKIRAEYAIGDTSYKRLAKKYDLHYTAIALIVKGKRRAQPPKEQL